MYFVICVIVGVCFLEICFCLIIDVLIENIFIFRWCCKMLYENNVDEFRYDYIIMFSFDRIVLCRL